MERLTFQSTRPVRGATTIMAEVEDLPLNFNPRAPCGARLSRPQQVRNDVTVFQSTRPVRGATPPRMG